AGPLSESAAAGAAVAGHRSRPEGWSMAGPGDEQGSTDASARPPGGRAATAGIEPAGPSRAADLHRAEKLRGLRPGDQYIRVTRHPDFRRMGAGHLVPRAGVGTPAHGLGRVMAGFRRVLFGRP